MSPGRPAGSIKTVVPRHNAQRIDARLVTEVGTIARGQGLKVDLCQHDPSNAVAQAIEDASRWNSLLITARAQRGPQWDINTQQFLVDEGSDLFYDPTPLLECQKESEEDNTNANNNNGADTNRDANREIAPPHDFFNEAISQGHRFQPNYPYGVPSPANVRHHAPVGNAYSGVAFTTVPQNQFYGMHGGDVGSSPMRMAVNPDGYGMNVTPRRVTRGMGMMEEGYPMNAYG